MDGSNDIIIYAWFRYGEARLSSVFAWLGTRESMQMHCAPSRYSPYAAALGDSSEFIQYAFIASF